MDNKITKDSVPQTTEEYYILQRAGLFDVRFKSPYNSIHQTSGLRSEDDAKTWIAETKILLRTYT